MSLLVAHPETGEQIDLGALAPADRDVLARAAVSELESIEPEAAEAAAIASALDARATNLRALIAAVAGVNGRVEGRETVAVVRPGKVGRRSVAAAYCEGRKEELLDLGLGREETVYRPPTLAELQAAEPRLLALGIPVDSLVTGGQPGPPRVELVPKANRQTKEREA